MVGCHSYTPSEAPAPGTVARVRVAVPGSSAVDGLNVAVESASLEGVVVSAGDTIVLAMRIRREWGSAGGTLRADTVRVTRDRLSSIEVKEVAVGKSLLLGAAIAGAATTLALILDIGHVDQVGAPGDEDDSPGGAVVSFPLGSIIARLLGGG